jgi:hypothetical protein
VYLEEKEAMQEVSGQIQDLLQNSMVWSLLEEEIQKWQLGDGRKLNNSFNFLTSLSSVFLGKEDPNDQFIYVFIIS